MPLFASDHDRYVRMRPMKKNVFIPAAGIITAIVIGYAGIKTLPRFFVQRFRFRNSEILMKAPVDQESSLPLPTEIPSRLPTPALSPTPAGFSPTPTPELTSVLFELPFTSQSPLGQWEDPLQQDGCEEASIMMAISWLRNEPLGTPQENSEKIRTIGLWEIDTFGPGHDTSAQDTADRILNRYFGWKKYTVKTLNNPQQIVWELRAGNLVITPMNGQLLDNPYFTQPGPERHMVVVKGYDAQKLEFITHDPGTRHGENYRYAVSVFWEAIRDYPTGDHAPIEKEEKRMIAVSR